MRKLLMAALLGLPLIGSAHADTIVLTGIVCDNTCFGYGPGDDTPDYLGLFGSVFGDLMGKKVELDVGATSYSLTINNHTLTFGFNDPNYKISFTDPLLSSFAPGAALFTATGLNPFGFAVAEAEFLCLDPIPGVPEPSTWALMILGFGSLAYVFYRRRRHGVSGLPAGVPL